MYYASVSSYIKDSIFDNKLEKWAKAAVCNQSNNKQVEKAIWFYFLWLCLFAPSFCLSRLLLLRIIFVF